MNDPARPRAPARRLMSTRRLAFGVAALVATSAAVGAPNAARAQIQTYYHVGAWDAFSGRNEQGGAVCGVGNTNPSDNRRLSIRFIIGGSETDFAASKPQWSIPDNTPIRVVMQIGLNSPWTLQASGHGHEISWKMDPNAIQWFDRQFRGASSMTLTFPDGNEPPWTVPLTGSSAISDAFGRCVRDLTRQVQAAPPGPNLAPPPQGPTQPFSAPQGAPPENAPPENAPPADAPPPADTQPNDTQPTQLNGQPPNGQPNATQPNGPPPR